MNPISIKTILLGLFISLSIYSFAQKTRKFKGIYKYNIADSLTGFLDLYPASDSTMYFYIYNTSKASIYFSWGDYGMIYIKDSVGIYNMYTDNTKPLYFDCRIYFEFRKGQINITTLTGHEVCLYGPNMHADGIYYQKNTKSPDYFIYQKKDTIYFNSTTLKSWYEF